MNQLEITKIKKEYYTEVIIGRLIKEMYLPNKDKSDHFRELAILNANRISFRGITFSSPQYLKRTLFNDIYSNLNYFGNDANMYISVARVKQFPRFTFKLKERSKETKPFFRKEYKNYMYRYDLFLDFDIDVLQKEKFKNEIEKKEYMSKNMKPFLKDIQKIIWLIEEYKLKAEVVFSGSRGFKVLIWNNLLSYNELVSITPNLPEKLGLKYLDLAGSFVLSKLMKCNLSLAFKDNKCHLVYPLKKYNYKDYFKFMKNFKTFECFEYKYFQDMNIKQTLPVYESQFLLDNNGITGFKKFIDDYKLLES